MKNEIPVITDKMGQHWRQPLIAGILIDDTHALMHESDFKILAEYSTSTPTGAYVGKCWKMNRPLGSGRWLLCWYVTSVDPGYMDIHHRIILVVN